MAPYIPQEKRKELQTTFAPETGGELNFLISKMIDAYVGRKGLSYKTIEEIIGACEGAKSEFYHRIARAYEDAKLAENGEVFTTSLRGLDYNDG